MCSSRVELKRLCEIFTRMFADPHSKVRSQRLCHSLELPCVYICVFFKDECFVFLPLPSAGESWHLINLKSVLP